MRNGIAVEDLFDESKRNQYDFSHGTTLVRPKNTDDLFQETYARTHVSHWGNAQKLTMRWARDKNVFTADYVARGKNPYDEFFQRRGPIRGDVLDIGGGWGLYRQWWEPSDKNVFVVHDPGVERFIQGPHEAHAIQYQRAFSLPMVFVEGFGESLPYRSGQFDQVLICDALDHCLDPDRVLAEARRCLRPSGTILISLHCEGEKKPRLTSRSFLRRLIRELAHPRGLATRVFYRFFQPVPHMNRFAKADMISRLDKAGFRNCRVDLLPATNNVFVSNVLVFEANVQSDGEA